jgi:hypothetical protein
MEKLHKNANLTNFRKLNYPNTIEIALIKENQKRTTPLQDMNHLEQRRHLKQKLRS